MRRFKALRDNCEDHQEVFEYWVCSNWLIDQLKDLNEPILETDFETWWVERALVKLFV